MSSSATQPSPTTQPLNIQAVLGSSASGITISDAFNQAIQAALLGGDATASYFQNQFVVGNFSTWLNEQGDQAWIADTDQQGNPVYFAAQMGSPDGSKSIVKTYDALSQPNTLCLMLATQPDSNVLSGSAKAQQFTFNGQSYNIVGSLTGTFSYNQEQLWYIQVPLGVVSLIPLGVLGKIAWPDFVKPILTGMWNGIKYAYSKVSDALSPADAAAAGDGAGDAAAVDGAEVGDDVVNVTAMGAACFSAFIVIAAIPLILQAIAHQSYHTVKVYNLTSYDLNWSLGYVSEGALNMAPVASQGSTSYAPLIPAMSSYSPAPNVNPVTVAHEADFNFTSASGYHGIGWVLSFTLNDPQNNDAQVASAAVVFDIPFEGDNSLYPIFNPVDTPDVLYNNYAGQQTVTQMVAGAVVGGTTINMTATYDYLDGQHPLPSGQNAYTYNSIIAFQPAS